MKPEKPKSPRQELEASLTALLLGELPADKAAALRELMAKDGELARLYERLEQTIGLVRETAVPTEETTLHSAPLKLSTKRREQLLAHFKTVAPKEFAKPNRREIRVRELAIAAGIVAFIGVAAWFTFNSTQLSFSSMSRMNEVEVVELGRPSAAMLASDSRSPLASTPRPVADNSLAPVQSPTYFTASADGGGLGGIGSPSQTIFDKQLGERRGGAVIVSSASKPSISEIVLPTATDYSVSATTRGFYDDKANISKLGDKEWVGVLERSNNSPTHSSTNQFVSRYAAIVVPSNTLELADMANLAYAPRVPNSGTPGTATNGIISQDAANFLYALRNSSESKPAENIPSIDPATGLPIPVSEVEGKVVAKDDLGGVRSEAASEQMPARTLRRPAVAPAHAPIATSPPIAGEKLAEIAQKAKDASGSNIYLGTELAKADVKFGTWGLETGGLPAGTKKEEESLRLRGEIVDGVTTAGRPMAPEKKGFALLGLSETPAQSANHANTVQSQGVDYFNGYTSGIPLGGSFTNAIAGITSQDGDQFYTWNPTVSDLSGRANSDQSLSTTPLNPGTGFFYLGDGPNQSTWVRNFTVDGVTPQLREGYKVADTMAAAEAQFKHCRISRHSGVGRFAGARKVIQRRRSQAWPGWRLRGE
jgi:hypothetical protein